MAQLRNAGTARKKTVSASIQTKGILRAEVRLSKPKAIREYTDAADTSGQIVEMMQNSTDAFMDTFARVVPFGDFYKKDAAVEIIWKEVKDAIMRRRMLRLLSLIPEKSRFYSLKKLQIVGA